MLSISRASPCLLPPPNRCTALAQRAALFIVSFLPRRDDDGEEFVEPIVGNYVPCEDVGIQRDDSLLMQAVLRAF